MVPTTNSLPLLTNGADVYCEPPFNLQEVARGAAGFVQRLDETAKKLDASVTDLRSQVLNAQTLANFGNVMTNLRKFSDQALGAVHDIHDIIGTNQRTGQRGGEQLRGVLRPAHPARNFRVQFAGHQRRQPHRRHQEHPGASPPAPSNSSRRPVGQGLAGELLQNNQTATNVQLLAENLSIASSNLNRFGLWHFLWSHPPPGTNTVKPVTLQSPPRRQ